jgi:hypothetical protein
MMRSAHGRLRDTPCSGSVGHLAMGRGFDPEETNPVVSTVYR